MAWLIDTNLLSELRKRDRMNPGVRAWYDRVAEPVYLSVITLGEVRQGITPLEARDPAQARALDFWLEETKAKFAGRILDVTPAIVDCWGRLPWRQPLPAVDGLIAATALVHDLTVVTRNADDFERSGCRLLNPWW